MPMDLAKIEAIHSWPLLINLHDIHSFLGLGGSRLTCSKKHMLNSTFQMVFVQNRREVT